MTHLWKEYRDKIPYAECGAQLTDDEINVKACLVDCAKCKKSAAFRQAAKNPFWGVDLKKSRKETKPTTEEDDVEYPEDDVDFDSLFDKTTDSVEGQQKEETEP